MSHIPLPPWTLKLTLVAILCGGAVVLLCYLVGVILTQLLVAIW